MSIPLLCAGFVGAAYAVDVLFYPQLIAQKAISYARARGGKVLTVGCGTPGSSLRTVLFGPTLWGDINTDIEAPRNAPCGPDKVCWADAQDLRQFPDKYFASSIASHVLEHVPRPDLMMNELRRVSDRVYIIVPHPYAPHSLFYTDHKWQIMDRTACALLWNQQYPMWTCFELPYSIERAMEGDFS